MNTDLVADAYGLSPMQQGMLLHTAYAHQRGVDIEQAVGILREPLDPERLQRAWQMAVNRHAALRTGFQWQGLEFPRQAVAPEARVALDTTDWRKLPAKESAEQFEDYLAADRARGFDLGRPPLMRLALFRTGAEEYRFVWTSHHLILDARAIGMVLQEVFAFYDALMDEREYTPPSPRPYRDYIDWLERQNWSRAEAYWRAHLKSAALHATGSILRRDLSIAGNQLHGRIELTLEAGTTSSLRRFAAEKRITLNTILQGAWALTLSHFSGNPEIGFGAVRACRRSSIAGAESMIGMLINTVPMRVNAAANKTVAEWLRDLRKEWLAVREHEHTPLTRIEEWCGLPDGQALFENVFSFQDPSWDAALYAQGGRWANRTFSLHSRSNYPLALDISSGDSTRAQLLHHRDCYDDAAASRMLAHWNMLLGCFIAGPQLKLRALPLLNDRDRVLILEEWNNTGADAPRDKTVQQLFNEQVRRSPEALAVADDQRELTYAQLNNEAGELARALRAMGVGPDVPVGVCMERSVDLVVATVAVLKAGGAFVPIDPANPPDRIAFMVKDSGAPAVLTQPALMKELELVLLDTKLICAVGVARELPQASQPSPKPEPGHSPAAQNLAYIIYTSGSTGTPKGVEIEHASLVNLISWHRRTYGVKPGDRATQIAGPGFDASIWEVLPYLTAGASIHIPDEQTRLSARHLVEWLSARQITLSFAPTPLAEAMLAEPWPDHLALRALLIGGDRLHRAPSEKHPFSIVNHYGPTECTVVATCCVVPGDDAGAAAPPIGRPVFNTQVYVVDPWMRPVPIGVAGELLIGGAGLARGYRNRPDLTTEKFIPNPFSADPGARLYRTGDLVRFLPDGNLSFLGRMDTQVKIRGHRIELGEIETVLNQHPGVRESAVTIHESEQSQNLVAYLVPAGAERPAAEELDEFLRLKLPASMVPSAFVILDALPLNPNGKVDRKALAATVPKTSGDAGKVAPRTPTETALARMWIEVLGVKQIGIHDNFFALGGHSLRAVRVIARAHDVFGVDLELREFFERPTIARLAALIDQADRVKQAEPAAPTTAAAQPAPQLLSCAQERLWFLAQMEEELAQNNIPLAMRLEGPLNVPALEQALGEIVRRHEPLRTVFTNAGGVPVARTLPWEPFKLERVQLDRLSQTERTIETDRIADEEARKPFDLGKSPLLRGRLLRWNKDNHVLLLTLHHIAGDGWSVGLLNRELAGWYDSLSAGRPGHLPELRYKYSDYAAWQRRQFEGKRLDQQLEYWKGRLGGDLPSLDLPADRPRPEVQSHRGALRSFIVPPSLAAKLAQLCRREEATLYMVLLAAFQTMLHRYTGQSDILIGSPVAGRQRAETEDLIGLFLNTVVMRGDLSGDPAFRELLRRTRELTLESFARQDVPFEKLVEVLRPGRDLSRSPLFQVMFVLQNEPLPPLELAGIKSTPIAVHSATSKIDLTLSIEERDGALCCSLEYSTDLFDEATIGRMGKHFTTLLADIAANPDRRLSELRLMTRDELHTVLVTWNQTSLEYPGDVSIHQMLRDQAARTPDAVALVFEDQELTYRDLDRRTDCLASELQSLGVRPEVRVGICVERSLEMVVALLAILKAGGAYVPLDPSYPAERLAVIAEDARIALLLTQQKLLQSLPRNQSRTVCLEELEQRRPAGELVLLNRAAGDNLAYVLYTSGSTGRPKGVMITHRNVVNFFHGMDRLLGRVPGVWLAVTSISFDISVLELFWTLARGFKVVVHHGGVGTRPVAREQRAPMRAHRATLPRIGSDTVDYSIANVIARQRVSHLQCTPSLAEMMIQDRATSAALKSLSTVLLGGEALSTSLVEKLPESLQILNMYGPTETTVWSAAHEVERGESPIPIGRPIANTQIYILDRQQRPVPVGVVGELYIGGDGVGRGYWNLPVLTAERFVEDPFTQGHQRRVYRTGDLARYRPAGLVEFLGRSDQQVKLRGFRVELGEIEVVMRRHPVVRECAVKVWEPAPGDKRLVGYVVAVPSRTIDAEALRQFLADALPDYMVPSLFVPLEELPLTPNGKLDRRALPDPKEAPAAAAPAGYRAPGTELERTVARIWREHLRIERVGRHDNFFDLGGHSLLLVQVQSRLQEALGRELSITALFQFPTVSSLAGYLAAGRASEPSFDRARSRARRQQAAFNHEKEGITA